MRGHSTNPAAIEAETAHLRCLRLMRFGGRATAARPAIVKPSDQPPAQTMILFIRPFVSEAAVIIEHTYMDALASKLFGCTDCEGDGLIVARAVTVLSDP